VTDERLPAYSGATVPVSHRVPDANAVPLLCAAACELLAHDAKPRLARQHFEPDAVFFGSKKPIVTATTSIAMAMMTNTPVEP